MGGILFPLQATVNHVSKSVCPQTVLFSSPCTPNEVRLSHRAKNDVHPSLRICLADQKRRRDAGRPLKWR
jgi:hypothetical protein